MKISSKQMDELGFTCEMHKDVDGKGDYVLKFFGTLSRICNL